MVSVLGFEAYEDFKRVLGSRWAYYLFPALKGDRWNRNLIKKGWEEKKFETAIQILRLDNLRK